MEEQELSYEYEQDVVIRHKKRIERPIVKYDILSTDPVIRYYLQKNGYEIYQEQNIPLPTKCDGSYSQLYYRRKGDLTYQKIGPSDITAGGGYENPRIFIMYGKTYLLCNGKSKRSRTERSGMYLICVETRRITELYLDNFDIMKIKYKGEWVPYVVKHARKERLYFIYSYDELCVLECVNVDDGRCTCVKGNPSHHNEMGDNQGGTPLISLNDDDNYVGFLHTRRPCNIKALKYNALKQEIEWIGSVIQTKFGSEQSLKQEVYDLEQTGNELRLSVCYDETKCINIYVNDVDIFPN
jgi:hypothetical protein